MGVSQNIRDRLRSFVYQRAQEFIKVEDGRKEEYRRKRFERGFEAFYDARELDAKGYDGHTDGDARILFKVYDKYGDKGLSLVGYHDGVHLSSRDMLNLLHLVEKCELIEGTFKGKEAGINLALRFVDEFSLDEVVGSIRDFHEPYLMYALNSRFDIEQIDKERLDGQDFDKEDRDSPDEELGNDLEEDIVSGEERSQIADVGGLIASVAERSRGTANDIALGLESNRGKV